MDGPLKLNQEHETISIPGKCRPKGIYIKKKALNNWRLRGIHRLMNNVSIISEMEVMNRFNHMG